jgi:subtilisin family serine protease
MHPRLLRSAIVGSALLAHASLSPPANAQVLAFTSCSVAGICGDVVALLTGTVLTVRIANLDNTFGSALFTTQITFADPLGGTPGMAFTRTATASLIGNVSSLGATPLNAWSFGGIGGSNVLDLSSFFNVYIEGTAPSPFRAGPGDLDNGTWVTNNGFVQFAADLGGIGGINNARFTGIGFCTDVGCSSTTTAAPEPSTLLLLATGCIALGIAWRRRRGPWLAMRPLRLRPHGLVGAFVAFMVAGCSDSNIPSAPRTTTRAVLAPRTDGYIVILKRGGASFSRVSPGARLGNVVPINPLSAAQNAVIADVVPAINGFVVRGVASTNDIAGDEIEAVIPNYVAEINEPTPDASEVAAPDFDQDPTGTDQSGAFFFANNTQWSYKVISANRVWAPSRGGAGAKVCITDSGIDAGHSAFVGKPILGASFLANSSPFTDTLGHGSHVAGTISTNGAGGASVAPDATLMMAKVFNATGGGASTAVVLNAVAWCTDNGADVINMSLSFTGGIPTVGNEAFINAYEAGLDYATSRGVLIVAAAGNDGAPLPFPGRTFLPAEAPGVVSVAATGPNTNLAPFGNNPTWNSPGPAFDGIASYSNRGSVPGVDISAPGGDLASGWPSQSLIFSVCSRQTNFGTPTNPSFPCAANGFWLGDAGTSMASPHVAGVAALIRSRWPSSGRSATLRNKIESCLFRSVDNIGPTSIFGRGRVNAYKATTQPC